MVLPRAQSGVVLALACAVVCTAAERTQPANFRADTRVVLISATVLDRNNRPVRGLARDIFRLFEDKAEQTIAYFGEEEIPLSLAVIFDMSASMESKLRDTRRALSVVLDTANPRDEFCLVSFSTRAEAAVPWTPEAGFIQDRVLFGRPHGRTSLLDAIRLGLHQMKRAANPRRAMVVFSDGGDNSSQATERQVSRLLEEADVQMYAIDMSEPAALRQRTPEELAGPGLLARLCERAGGRYFTAHYGRELNQVADQISRELRSQYVLGYVPTNTTGDGKYRRVQVKVARPENTSKLYVYWRRGYRAPQP